MSDAPYRRTGMSDPVEESVRGLTSAYEIAERMGYGHRVADGQLIAAAILLVGSEILDVLASIRTALEEDS